MEPLHILAITPGLGFLPEAWERVLESGVDGFMVREPGLEAGALLAAARWCRTHFPATQVWVNGRLDVALAADCGLHAPEAYPENLEGLVRVSRPLHAETQFQSRRQAQQLLVGPVFEVPGKGAPWGAGRLHSFLEGCTSAGPTFLALGGVTPARMKELRHPQLSGVALIRALWDARDPRALVRQLRAAWAS